MKSGCTVFRKRNRRGMTLVEVLVFMTLTISTFAGLISASLRATHLDKATEERTAAFFSCESSIEKLRKTPFTELTSSTSGFVLSKDGKYYSRETKDIPFYTRGDLRQTQTKGRETVILRYGTDGESQCCRAIVKMIWYSPKPGGGSSRFVEKVSFLLYP